MFRLAGMRLIAAAFAAFALLAPARAAVAPGAVAPIERLTTTLLETMKQANALGFEGRFAKLEPVLRTTFDFPFMARLSVGPEWRKLDAGQQAALVEHFARMSVATFAARFDGYSGQTFEVLNPREGPRDTVMVPTKLNKGSGEAVTISYLMRRDDSQWQAVDVYLKGTYSELATKRSEYASVIRREGFSALLDRIESRIAKLRADGAPAED